VLPASLERILREVPDEARVLDVGGWARPLNRADWVLDLLPYETRGMLGADGPGPERFSAGTWVVRDVCDREPWPFEDGRFDFAVCSHTLEDVRDPIWVCEELSRVARAGYVEVPSRLEEQSLGVHGPWVGWSHHRWLCEVRDGALELVMKPHLLHARESDHFPAGFHATLSDEERVEQLWWEGELVARERVFVSAEELDPYLSGLVSRELAGRGMRRPRPTGLRALARRLAR
jgi:hypothetical protein